MRRIRSKIQEICLKKLANFNADIFGFGEEF